jgi:hypothetical protein
MSGWQLHLVPTRDRKQHQADHACWCEPTLEDRVFVHHAADRREASEGDAESDYREGGNQR